MHQTLVGVFDRQEAARRAAAVLQDSGFAPDTVQVSSDAAPPAAEPAHGERHGSAGVVDSVRSFFAEVFGPADPEDAGDGAAYRDALRRGGALVKVEIDQEGRLDEARRLLVSAGAVSIDERQPRAGSAA